ncbi:trigger factor [Panacibacter ginsenosidivorans]|uniref:Trigger factor n=1 Tax=Panacibacter ginsenosidivorans TaxID=1813871 RepID=A0A5B8V7J6_9BACT|nr:trigger factor [Panacibacter ginsenosidivorans]QEC67500.1 trigger factor [Panacibacter ginsenosidivorans]
MATVTRENIGKLTDKLIVKVAKEDYLQSFESSLKKYAKTANISGFRKGMVPASLVKKMYGQGVFSDEVLRLVEKQLQDYMVQEQLDIFAQPLPLENDARMLDMNNPADYAFAFEIGLKPAFDLHISDIKVTRYVIQVTEQMINEEVERLTTRHGKMTEPEAVSGDNNVLNVEFTEVDKDGNAIEGGLIKSNSLLVKYFAESVRPELIGKKKDDTITIQLSTAFDEKEREWVIGDLGLNKDSKEDADKLFKLLITKVGLVEKAEMTESFFETVYPGRSIKTEEEFRNAVKVEIENYYAAQSSNQVHDQIYHHLTDHTTMDFPESFLKRWLKDGSEKQKTDDETEKEYPSFVNQLKWSLISSKLINENKITVDPAEIRQFALNQIAGYMGMQNLDEAPWLDEYANRMMKDQKFVEETYMKLQTEKLFRLVEQQVQATEESISAEDFAKKLHHHHH